MRGFGHSIQAGFQNFIAALGTKTIAALVQALERGPYFIHAGNLTLAYAKVHIPLGNALCMRVARPGQGVSRHFRPCTLATTLLADQAQQISQHVFKTFKVHHGVVVLHGGDSVGHRRIMRVDREGSLDFNQMKRQMPKYISTKPHPVQHLLHLDLIHADNTGG